MRDLTRRLFGRQLARHTWLALLVVVGGTLACEVGYGGAGLGEALVYVGYEGVFIVGPGCLAFRALAGRPGGPLRQLAIGWALGYVLEILAFMLTAACGVRWLFFAHPLVVAAAAIWASRRRGPPSVERDPVAPTGRGFVWLLAFVCLGAVAYVALSYFPETQLPGAQAVFYSPDNAWAVSLAAEAKHHWPIQDPNVAGEPLVYHYFVHIHLAAASQTTGLGLPVVYFRLFIAPMVVAIVLGLVAAGQTFARSSYVGLIAACLVFFVGQIRLDANQSLLSIVPFLGALFTFMVTSPSFLFGLVVFVPLIILLAEATAARRAISARGWALIALFMVGASGAKVAILPLVFAALVLTAAWQALSQRRVAAGVWRAAGLALLVTGTVYLLQYRGHSSGLGFAPLASFDEMTALVAIRSGLAHVLPAFPGRHPLITVVTVVLGSFGLLAASLGGFPLMARRFGFRRLRPDHAWLLSLLTVGLLTLVTLTGKGTGNQLYFAFYGLVAGCLLSATGLRAALPSQQVWRAHAKPVAALFAVWLALLSGLLIVSRRPSVFPGPRHAEYMYLFLYAALGLGLMLLFAAARRWTTSAPGLAAVLVCAAVLLTGALDTPLSYLVPALTKPTTPPAAGRRLTPELYAALTWIRDRADPRAVIATNGDHLYGFDYGAFAERRVFLGGWGYSLRARDEGRYGDVVAGRRNPFEERRRLNERVFAGGDREALRQLVSRYGVRYLLIDAINAYPVNQSLTRLGRVVYTSPDAKVLKLG